MNKKYALVTGATKGIGKAVVFGLAEKGYNVAFCSRTNSDGVLVLEELKKQYPNQNFFFSECDVRNKTSIDHYINVLLKDFSNQIDVLVNNAGVFFPGSIIEEEEDQLAMMIETNLYSAYHITRIIAPLMIAKKQGAIFNMCSVASLHAYPNGGSYSISKFALHGFSKVLREELKTHNIKVTSVFPGATWSDSWKGVNLPTERLMEPEDIAKLITATLELSHAANVEDIIVRPQLGDL